MPDIDQAASKLRPTYKDFKAAGGLSKLLRAILQARFALSGYPVGSDPSVERSSPVSLYLSSIEKAFYQVATDPGLVTNDNRERVVLALLSSEGAVGNLAIHVYLALMEGVSAMEVVDILFLSGIYSGVNRLSRSLEVADVVFLTVAELASDTPPSVEGTLKKIIEQFPEERALLERLSRG